MKQLDHTWDTTVDNPLKQQIYKILYNCKYFGIMGEYNLYKYVRHVLIGIGDYYIDGICIYDAGIIFHRRSDKGYNPQNWRVSLIYDIGRPQKYCILLTRNCT